MKSKNKISVPDQKAILYFNEGLFWDVDKEDVLLQRDKSFVINRALRFSRMPGILDLIDRFYSKSDIVNCLLSHKSLFDKSERLRLNKRYGLIN